MAKRTLDIKPAKYLQKQEPLVYKDASDVSDGDGSSDNDQALSDEEAEEEIKEIPLGQKRQHLDHSFSDGEEGEDQMDDSVSDSEQDSSNGDEDMADSEVAPDERLADSDSGFDELSEQSEALSLIHI